MRTRRPSPLRAALGLLALGAATSVLVAWACFFRLDMFQPSDSGHGNIETLEDETPSGWGWWQWPGALLAMYSGDFNRPAADAFRFSESFPPSAGIETRRRAHAIAATHRREPQPRSLSIMAAGWPFHCLTGSAAFTSEQWDSTFSMPRKPGAFHAFAPVLPSTPLPGGLLLNTLFYAALWSLPLVAAPALIRWRRARSGLCPSCSYDLAGLDACPECGSAATSS